MLMLLVCKPAACHAVQSRPMLQSTVSIHLGFAADPASFIRRSWPYLGAAPELAPTFLLGSAILVGGLLLYNLPSWREKGLAAKKDS